MPRRKGRRRVAQEDEGSSDSPLTKALRVCRRDDGDTTAAAGEDGQDFADGVEASEQKRKRNWRKQARENAQRGARIGREALDTIQVSLGRVPTTYRSTFRKRRKAAPPAAFRKQKAGSFTTKCMIEMALPETEVGGNALRREPLLASARTQAGSSGTHHTTIERARALGVNALADGTEQCLSSLAASCDGPLVVKTSWDETALRFYCPLGTLKSIIGNVHVEPHQVKPRRRRADGRGVRDGQEDQAVVTTSQGRPSYVVQVMQASSSVLLGDTSSEVVCRPTLCTSTSASDLHQAFKPWVYTDLLCSPGAEPAPASRLLALAADSHPSDNLLVSQIAADIPSSIPVHDALCLGHQVSLACDDVLNGMKDDLDMINPLFATKKLMQQLQPRAALYHAIDRDGDKANIIRGVWPPPELKAHAECVLGHTLGDGIEQTLYTLRCPARSEFDDKDAAIVADFMRMFNGNWKSGRWEHYCCISADDRRPCCRNVEESKAKMKVRSVPSLKLSSGRN